MNKEVITATERLLNNIAWMSGDLNRLAKKAEQDAQYEEEYPTPISAGAVC